ncbi:MAG: N-acetylmuramoyl-L-alanine amidase [Lachnospiraceae bacterium]|nr:N-acetylmuramoyl-L-alanine amidase [Lachnospiraceae bacterium]
MKQLVKTICMALMVTVLIIVIGLVGIMSINQKRQDRDLEERIELAQAEWEALSEAEERKQEEETARMKECERIVLVKELPVYSGRDITENFDTVPVAMLHQKDIIWILEEEGQYALISTENGKITGYVWKDCIGKKEDYAQIPSYVVVIDAGHQEKADLRQEPVGPGAEETKDRVKSGATGTSTSIPEYKLTLNIALALEEELLRRGDYIVIQVRRQNDINISNAERAWIANQIHADAMLRIHANGSDNPSVSGADTYCVTNYNAYSAGATYEESKRLAENILEAYTDAVNIRKNYVNQSDAYTGLNWCEIPSVILEMGYLSNPEDDVYLNDSENWKCIAGGIADGLDDYFQEQYRE